MYLTFCIIVQAKYHPLPHLPIGSDIYRYFKFVYTVQFGFSEHAKARFNYFNDKCEVINFFFNVPNVSSL